MITSLWTANIAGNEHVFEPTGITIYSGGRKCQEILHRISDDGVTYAQPSMTVSVNATRAEVEAIAERRCAPADEHADEYSY